MYEFGAGLDIRESPKQLGEQFCEVIVDRLQLIDAKWDPDPTKSATELIKGKKLAIRRFRKSGAEPWSGTAADWQEVLAIPQTLGMAWEGGSYDHGLETSRGSQELRKGFVSSGENQAFFLLSYLNGLATSNSCLFLDEPELHLSPAAGSRLVRKIVDHIDSTGSQALVVTHLPQLFRDEIILEKGGTADGRRRFHVAYLPRDEEHAEESGSASESSPAKSKRVTPKQAKHGMEAVNAAAAAARKDIHEIASGMHLEADRTRLLPRWLRPFFSEEYRMGPAFVIPALVSGLVLSGLSAAMHPNSPFAVSLLSVTAFAFSFVLARFIFVRAGNVNPAKRNQEKSSD